MEWYYSASAAAVTVFIIFLAVKTKGNIFKSALCGILCFFGMNLSGMLTGFVVGVNIITFLCSFFLGIPGVAMMILIKLI